MKNICEWISCNETGDFKAPAEKDNSRKFKLLCEKHVKLFNKNWNYFAGMSQNEIESFVKSDITWHRPTQEFGSSQNYFNILWNNALDDNFNFFNQNKNNYKHKNKLCKKDEDAFVIMGLELNSDWQTIQKKFKVLVKKFHPDKHFGSTKYEDKLKKITLAYSHLKMIMVSK